MSERISLVPLSPQPMVIWVVSASLRQESIATALLTLQCSIWEQVKLKLIPLPFPQLMVQLVEELTVTINGINDVPVAVDDTATTDEDSSIVIAFSDLFNNDSDVDGDSLFVSDFDNTSAFGGTVAMNDDGSFTYTPEEYFAGIDSFSYTISDGNNGTDTADVFVTVEAQNQRGAEIDSLTGLRSDSSTVSGYFDIHSDSGDPQLKVQLATLSMTYDRKEREGGKGRWIDVALSEYQTDFWIDSNRNGSLNLSLGEEILLTSTHLLTS